MRSFIIFSFGVLLIGGTQGQDKKESIHKQTVRTVEGLQFSPVRFSVKRKDKVQIVLKNRDPNDQPHNFVLIKPGSLSDIQLAALKIGPESVANAFVPDHDAVIAASGLLNPDEEEVITFDTPKKSGIYPYVCTFPGHATVMYGALYVNTNYTETTPFDPNIPELARQAELQKLLAKVEVERPTFSRLFMPEAGPAAIAIALPEGQNVCWDAGTCRLRYAWSGAFVDPTRMLGGNGNALGKILGDVYWSSRAGETVYGIQVGDADSEEVDFIGYRIIDGVPQFHYSIDTVSIKETFATGADGELLWKFQTEGAKSDLKILAPATESVKISCEVGKRGGDHWVVPQADAANFTLNLTK